MSDSVETANRALVTPGALVARGRYKLEEGVFREGDEIFSSVIGLVDLHGNSVRVIPLEGPYIPKPGDRIVGMVSEVQFLGWMVYIHSPTPGILKVSEVPYNFDVVNGNLEDILKTWDLIYAEILSVNELMQVKLTMQDPELRKLVGGRVFTISPAKVPRVIGRKGSMITMLKRSVCREILVGQNGIVWARCSDPRKEDLLKRILGKIESEAHTSGLTNRIKSLLQEETGFGEAQATDSGRQEAGW